MAGLSICASASQLRAQTADPTVGRHLAQTVCADCHQIAPGSAAKTPNTGAPSFVDVAQMPSTTELSIKVFLRSSHRAMPNILLTTEEIDSVAAYIVGLRKQ